MAKHARGGTAKASKALATKQDSGSLVWEVPPPSAGAAYSATELASLANVELGTVRAWISKGVSVNGQRVKLKTLRAPRGRIVPAALADFLHRVNDIEVRIGDVS